MKSPEDFNVTVVFHMKASECMNWACFKGQGMHQSLLSK